MQNTTKERSIAWHWCESWFFLNVYLNLYNNNRSKATFKHSNPHPETISLLQLCVLPGNLVTAGHGEESLPLQNSVPCLDGVAGAHWDGALA